MASSQPTESASETYDPITSLGIYYKSDKEHIIGYWLVPGDKRNTPDARKYNLITICTVPMNSQFTSALLEAARTELPRLLNIKK